MTVHAVGLMSGTSLDGLDICHAVFNRDEAGKWQFQILNAQTFEYNKSWENRLRDSIHLSAEDFLELNSAYGFFLGEKVRDFLQNNYISKVDLIASHGHTVFHQPKKGFTAQIGEGRAIKIITKLPVVYDFRSQDVLMGGSGAPLVPIGDELLFSEFDACLNIGGFSNISFQKNGQRIAFDICPVNIVLNKYAEKLGKNFDENGDIAKSGKVNSSLLDKLNSLDFYKENHPKSLGVEWVNYHIEPLLQSDEAENILATFTEHVACQISAIFNENKIKKVLFTGGGTYNTWLIELLRAKTSTEIIIPAKDLIDFKEALIFAFMGVLRVKNEINILSSATGSSDDHSSGLLV